MRIAVVHGPNLRLLGRREPEVYGRDTLDDVNRMIADLAEELGVEVEMFQSNHEGELIDFIDAASARVGRILDQSGRLHPHVYSS